MLSNDCRTGSRMKSVNEPGILRRRSLSWHLSFGINGAVQLTVLLRTGGRRLPVIHPMS